MAAEGRACVIIVNKWDAIPDKARIQCRRCLRAAAVPSKCFGGPAGADAAQRLGRRRLHRRCSAETPLSQPFQENSTLPKYEEDLLAQMRPINWASVVFTSAVTGQRVSKVLEAVATVGEQHRSPLPLPLLMLLAHGFLYAS